MISIVACSDQGDETQQNEEVQQTSIKITDVNQTVNHIQKLFDINKDIETVLIEEPGKISEVYKINDQITISLDDNQEKISKIEFIAITEDDAQKVLNDIKFPASSDFESLLADSDNYNKNFDRRYYFIEYKNMGVNLVNMEKDLSESMGREGSVNLFLIYDETLFEEFTE